jgi:uncharacterized membrane protein
MNRYIPYLIWPVFLAPAVYFLLSWKNIPENIPMKYNLDGQVTRYGNKTEVIWLVVILTVVSLATYFLLINVHKLDPKKTAAANRERMKKLAFGISFFLSAFAIMMIYYITHPSGEFRFNLVTAAVGLLFAFIGNYLHSIKPNYFAGLRLPWTLENEENWRLTHALGGKIWFAGGLLIAVISLVTPSKVALISMFVLMAFMVFVPLVFSYRLYKKQSSQKA